MKIPLGKKALTEQQKSNLEKLGFDIKKIQEINDQNIGFTFYTYDLPDDDKLLKAIEAQTSLARHEYTVFYGDHMILKGLISIGTHANVDCTFYEENISAALKADSKKFTGIPYQEALKQSKEGNKDKVMLAAFKRFANQADNSNDPEEDEEDRGMRVQCPTQ